MSETKINILEVLTKINSEINTVNKEIERTIQTEGLDNNQIDSWINFLNQIIRKSDHAVEVLEESKN